MSDTFKEQVEEILSELVGVNCDCNYCANGRKHYTDRILAAHNAELDRIAEGMKLHPYPTDGIFAGSVTGVAFTSGADLQLWDDQAYIQAQKGS